MPATFDGPGVEQADVVRLTGQLARVYDVLVIASMVRGDWLTLAEIAQECRRLRPDTHDSEAGISARLRDLRKPRFGGYEVLRRRRTQGQWEYRLVLPVKPNSGVDNDAR